MPPSVIRQFRDWFWRPPRAHGEVIRDRSVSYLELLYDLVYVAVIAQVAGALAKNVSVETVIQFAVIFTLVWIAWINGTLYLELHGREDGRTRAFVFVQMGILALVAVFAGTAAADGGTGFAIAYFVFLIVQTLGWNSVRRLDTPEVARVTIQYIGAMLAMAVLILISAFLAPGPRLVTWALASAAWLVYMVILGTRSRSFRLNVIPTHSMVERFDLFVIIVLGELVFDVVVGLSNTKHDLLTIGTGVLALFVGLGFWWIYFDVVGRRLPREGGRALGTWIIAHLPITLAIVAAGAAMVALIGGADQLGFPATAGWVLAGSVALVLVGQIVISRVLVVAQEKREAYRSIRLQMALAAVAAVVAGALLPSSWLLALVLGAILLVLWFAAVVVFIRADAWPPR